LYAILYDRITASVASAFRNGFIPDIVIDFIIIHVDGVHCPRDTRINDFHPYNVFKGGAKINNVIVWVRIEITVSL
jgi:hypothetical protein